MRLKIWSIMVSTSTARLGCGRGAVLMLAARRLPAGRAVGADVWRRRDQSGNSRAAAERNAVPEGVRGRVELAGADARYLPFGSASFDLVVSSLAISSIRGAAGRLCRRYPVAERPYDRLPA